MKVLTGFSPIARAVIVTAAIALVMIFLQSAASVIAPILLAAFITMVATPPLRWMHLDLAVVSRYRLRHPLGHPCLPVQLYPLCRRYPDDDSRCAAGAGPD